MSNQESQAEAVSMADGVTVGRQALRRMVNARLYRTVEAGMSGTINVFCECGRRACADRVQINVTTYESVLKTAGQHVITPRHDEDGRQRLVGRHHSFLVVARDGL
jgi:hypothetical protein